jgi:hypothetical protein
MAVELGLRARGVCVAPSSNLDEVRSSVEPELIKIPGGLLSRRHKSVLKVGGVVARGGAPAEAWGCCRPPSGHPARCPECPNPPVVRQVAQGVVGPGDRRPFDVLIGRHRMR